MQHSSGPLILPGHPLFHRTTDTAIPPEWQELAASMGQLPNFIVDAATGLMRPAQNQQELDDYLDGGEYEQRLAQMDTQPEVEHWDLDRGLVECW
ncbi:MAG: hypothetical protein AAGD09_10110 [Cyanobacteria bacterium P01_F01_bin.56]